MTAEKRGDAEAIKYPSTKQTIANKGMIFSAFPQLLPLSMFSSSACCRDFG
jgi:hypothetical protein